MSFVEREHINPGAVVNRLNRWNQVFSTNLIQETIENELDYLYKLTYRMAPVKTGYLRSTIKVTSGGSARDAWGELVVTARYAYYVDKGMSPRGRRRPQPFWTENVVGASLEMIVTLRRLFGFAM